MDTLLLVCSVCVSLSVLQCVCLLVYLSVRVSFCQCALLCDVSMSGNDQNHHVEGLATLPQHFKLTCKSVCEFVGVWVHSKSDLIDGCYRNFVVTREKCFIGKLITVHVFHVAIFCMCAASAYV